jgi:hypothetical protein
MRFLALTTLQSALLAVLTASAILALYFLKHKRQRIVISSVLLWRKVIENRLENSLFEKLRRLLSIVIAMATGLLIALAIARPEIEWLTGKPRRAVIVLDTSPTMQARTADGKTRWQHAVERARELVGGGSVSTQFRVADTTGQFDFPFTADHTDLYGAIDRMHPAVSPARFPDLDKAQEKTTQDIYLITDGVSPLPASAGTTLLSVFEPAPNVGITAFEIRSMPSATLVYEAYLEVWNFGKDSREVEISVSGAGQQRITRKTKLAAGKSYREALDLSQFEGGGIRAAVQSDGDAFAVDDIAYAYVPVNRRTKTLLVTRGNRLLETALKLDRLIDLSVTSPDAYNAGADVDVFVFDGYAPTDPPARPALIVGAPRAPWLRPSTGTVARPAFESWMEGHPVLQQVSLHDVSVENATRIDPSNLSVLAAASGNMPLIVASERPRWIMLTFDLRNSDFPYHSGFPLFIDNTIAWFARERLALRRSPGVVNVPIPGAQIRTIDGRTISSHDHAGGTTFEADIPGLYVASQANERQYIAVNFADHQLSEINNSRLKESKTARSEAPLVRRELWFYMLCAALLLVGAEWFTYHRRITL